MVAHVAGHDITQDQWDRAHKAEIERIRASMPQIDVKLLDTPQARYATLERLVREQALALAADKFHVTTSDARLARYLQEDPAIASLRKPDGSLDMDRYRQLAAAQGLTPEGFEAAVRAELSKQQLQTTVVQSAFEPTALSKRLLDAMYEQREVQVARFLAKDFVGKMTASDDEVKAYYTQHPDQFQAPEQAKVEYVVLDLDAVKKTMTLNPEDVKAYYEQNSAKYITQEERRASHILVAVDKSATDAAKAQALKKAQGLLAQVRANPARFSAVATANSQDPGSAAKGGDLGFFGRGAMVKPFEEAVFSMKKAQISDLVASDFGYHIIMLTDIKPASTQSFESVRPSLEAELVAQQAQRKFADVAEQFTNMVYEQADSLQPVAEKLKLTVRTADKVLRQPAANPTGPLANEKFLAALFAKDATDRNRNTEAVEFGANQMVAGRVVQYSAAHTLPLEEATNWARSRVLQEKAVAAARKAGQDALAGWQVQGANPALAAAQTVSRQEPHGLSASELSAALTAARNKLPAWAGVDLADSGYTVIRVNKVLNASEVKPGPNEADRARLVQMLGKEEASAYYNTLKTLLKLEMPPPPAPTQTGVGVTGASG